MKKEKGEKVARGREEKKWRKLREEEKEKDRRGKKYKGK